MDWRLFSSTFILIFMAELGDKTQLAVMCQSASTSSRMTVFWAAALALATSTAVGVLCGSLLRRWVPDDRYIKVAGGILFLIFGSLLLREGLRAKDGTKVQQIQPIGALGRFVLAQAAYFEQAACDDYLNLAATTTTPELRKLFNDLAIEEKGHIESLTGLHAKHTADFDPVDTTVPYDKNASTCLHDVASDDSQPVLKHAIAHELATAAFYHELARRSAIPGIKNAFIKLAESEEQHAERIRCLLPKETEIV